jgi:hypothetical protein
VSGSNATSFPGRISKRFIHSSLNLSGSNAKRDSFVPHPSTSSEAAYPSSTCEWDLGANGAADSNGDDQISLVFADSSTITADDFTIYDIFGVPGQDGTGTVHEF